MNNNHRYTIFFSMLGVAAISSGMGLKNIFEYSPSFGWILGTIFFFTSSYFATKLNLERKK